MTLVRGTCGCYYECMRLTREQRREIIHETMAVADRALSHQEIARLIGNSEIDAMDVFHALTGDMDNVNFRTNSMHKHLYSLQPHARQAAMDRMKDKQARAVADHAEHTPASAALDL